MAKWGRQNLQQILDTSWRLFTKNYEKSYNALRMIKYMEEDYAPNEVVVSLLKEAEELVAIFTATPKEVDSRK